MDHMEGDAAIVIALSAAIAPADIPGLCQSAVALIRATQGGAVVCDVGAVTDPDAAALDAVARLQLTAMRAGRELRLRHACDGFQELIALAGLSEVVLLVPG